MKFLLFVLILFVSSTRFKFSSATSHDVRTSKDDYPVGSRRFLRSDAISAASFGSTIGSSLQDHFWLAMGKSIDDVKEKLGLKGLIGEALKSAPNYPRFRAFSDAKERQELQAMLDADVSSHVFWVKKKLNSKDITVLRHSDEFKLYVRYSEMEDDKLFTLWNQGLSVKIDDNNGPLELAEKMKIWIARDRPNKYVEHLLKLDGLKPAEKVQSKYAQLYLSFLRARKDRNMLARESFWKLNARA